MNLYKPGGQQPDLHAPLGQQSEQEAQVGVAEGPVHGHELGERQQSTAPQLPVRRHEHAVFIHRMRVSTTQKHNGWCLSQDYSEARLIMRSVRGVLSDLKCLVQMAHVSGLGTC